MATATSKYHTEKALLFELLHEDYHPGVGAGQHEGGLINWASSILVAPLIQK
jgi:hypothetical protein